MIVDITDIKLGEINFTKNYDYARYKKARSIYNLRDVEIVSAEENNVEGEKKYNIKAKVNGNYGRYTINLEILGKKLKSCKCTCADFEKGNLCKHILATCMEAVDPHSPNTKEGLLKLIAQRRKDEEERKKALKLKQEEERKKREYREKYSYALSVLDKYGETVDLGKENELESPLDIQNLFNKSKDNRLRNNNYDVKLDSEIKIEPKVIVDYRGNVEVTFKIGASAMYSLKDMYEFYQAFENGSYLEFGKKLKFYAKRENFTLNDQKLLEYILNYGSMLNYQKSINQVSYYYSTILPSKSIMLFNEKIEEFFELLKNRSTKFAINSYENYYQFSNLKLNPKVTIEKLDNGDCSLELDISSYNLIESLNNVYVLYNNNIYTIDKKQNSKLIELLNIFKASSKILIPNDKFDKFSTYVLPLIDKYIDIPNEDSLEDETRLEEELKVNEILDNEINNEKQKNNRDSQSNEVKKDKNEIYINKLACKVYLDLDEKDNILLLLKFCYKDFEFNILEKDFNNYVKENNVTRNVQEEKKVLTRLFDDGFEIEKGKTTFVLKDVDLMYDFLSSKIEGYMNDFEVLVTEKLKNKNVKKPKISSINVRLDNGLLEFDMSKTDFDMDEIKKILQSYNIKKKYYKLKNGDFLDLEKNEDLDLLNDISTSLDVDFEKAKNGVVKLPVNRSLYLEKLLDTNKSINTSKNEEYNNLVNNISNKNFSDNITISKKFEKVLRDYQKTGYKWLKVLESYGFGGILADDMGLGKTLQVIALFESNMKSKNKKASIVVCPSSLVLNWKAEIEKWCNSLKVLIISGTANERKELINKYNDYDLVITSYDLLKRDIEHYEDKLFKYIIADEAQYIKNFSTQNATALKSLDGEVKFALTGTPIENSISELWSIFDFIMPGYLYNYNKFKKKFEEPILKQEDKEALKRLKSLIEPFILRRVKKDVLTELPEKNITILNNEMTKEQQQLYISYLAQIKQEVASEVNENGFEKSKLKILMLLTRLRQICCHPSLFIENYKGESGKLAQCMDIVKEAIASNHKILLFSQYTSMFEIIEKCLDKEKINYYKLTGSTPVDKRINMVDEFNKNEEVKVFLISLKAGGTGLNLTGADVVIHYDPWWNVSSENQATDRAYRIGQKNSVQVYKLITTNSIEEKINKLQEKKAKLSEELLSTEETFINKLSKEEIMSLFE